MVKYEKLTPKKVFLAQSNIYLKANAEKLDIKASLYKI